MNKLIAASICMFCMLKSVVLSTVSSIQRAEIQTCSGCKLNKFAAVRKFVIDEENGALSFDRVTRKIIAGHNPDLVFFGVNDHELDRLDMTRFTFDELVSLLFSNGFSRLKTEL